MNKQATGIVTILQGLGIIAVVAFVIAIHVGSFQLAGWLATAGPWWLTVPLTLLGGCYLVVRGIKSFDREHRDHEPPEQREREGRG